MRPWSLRFIGHIFHPALNRFRVLGGILSVTFKSRATLLLENLALRHQLSILHRSVKRPKLTAAGSFLWALLSRAWADWRSALVIVKPGTVIAWHRKGFRLFWAWKVRRGKPGRPAVPKEIRDLIRRISNDNPLWGAPRVHGELLKLGIDSGETSVGKYMVRRRDPPSQTWRTFLENHRKTMVSIDFFTVQTLRFQILYVFLMLAHDRRWILHLGVSAGAGAGRGTHHRHPPSWRAAPPLRAARSLTPPVAAIGGCAFPIACPWASPSPLPDPARTGFCLDHGSQLGRHDPVTVTAVPGPSLRQAQVSHMSNLALRV